VARPWPILPYFKEIKALFSKEDNKGKKVKISLLQAMEAHRVARG
jgi:hypothetical protein